jgi:hypothetical protein
MLTLISVPRAFSGRTAAIQHSAIGSWVRLDPNCEVILFGDDPGVAEAAFYHGVRHEPRVTRTPQGTPILSDIFARADLVARHPLLCFVNTDVVLFDDVIAATKHVAAARRHFLIVSSRFNYRIEEPLTFSNGWHHALRVRVRRQGRMYPAGGSDIFIYPRGLFGPVPPFAIGRNFWDNWLMDHALRSGASLIDATQMITAAHQEHDYQHIAGMPADSKDDRPIFMTEEGRGNLALARQLGRLATVYDATEILTADGRLVSTLRPALVGRRIKAWLRRAGPAMAPRSWHTLTRLREALLRSRGG